jgi:hypothetical protein
MTKLLRSALVVLLLPILPAKAETADDGDRYRLSGPEVHDNLAVFFIHGRSAPGAAPLTLQEALAAGKAKVYETGNVNELAIENTGDQDVFVQSGDIVKGGQQDRVLMVSLVMPAKSGRMPIGSFCVEHGRWTKRGAEDAKSFASADAVMPSTAGKLAIAKATSPDAAPQSRPASVAGAQQEVWSDVERLQRKLSSALGSNVTKAESPTSLKLALENKTLADAQAPYIAALKPAGEKDEDILGYAVAINGKLAGADLYPSNALFRKMWARLLTASVVEAVAEKDAAAAAAPTREAAQAFLDQAAKAPAKTTDLNKYVRQSKRENARTISVETARTDGSWVHRSVVAQ